MTNCKQALDFRQKFPAAICVKDMQKQLSLPKFSQQPFDYYRKVIILNILFKYLEKTLCS